MGKFYLDLEFTNGNFYLADILELALLSEESGYAFHSYVKIHYSVWCVVCGCGEGRGWRCVGILFY